MLIRLFTVACLVEIFGEINAKAVYQSDRHLLFVDSAQREEVNSRTKRGLVSVIVYGTSLAARTTSLGISLASVISEGCSVRKSICTDRDAINRMDKEIQVLKDQYDEKYLENKKDFLNFRKAGTNNAYIEHYINESISNVEEMAEIQAKAYELLQKEIPNLLEKYDSLQNVTSEQYLETVIGQLEVSLSDIRDMVKKQVKNQLIGFGVQLLVEELLERFLKSFSTTRQQIINAQKHSQRPESAVLITLFKVDPDEALIILNPDHKRHNEIMKKHGLSPKATKMTLSQNIKLTGDTFKVMLKNTGKYFADKKAALGNIKKNNLWKGFKGKLQTSLGVPLKKMKMMKAFVTNAKARKFVVKNFKLGWSQGLMSGIGIIMDVVEIAAVHSDWGKVAAEMQKARKQYEQYLRNLTQEVSSLDDEKQEINTGWANITEAFSELTGAFRNITTYAENNSEFNNVFGLTGLPFSPQSPIFTIEFDSVTKDSLQSDQNAVISFIRDINKNLSDINDEFKAKNILYEDISIKTPQNYSVKSIYESLKRIYSFSPSKTVIDFGGKMTIKDVVCSIAKLRIDIDEYDFYSLSPFRPRCEVSDLEFNNIQNTAESHQRKIVMRATVKEQIGINDKITIAELLLAVKYAYEKLKDTDLKSFGNTLTERDVVCAVSEKFPYKQVYDYFSLSSFRPDCSAVSTTEFSQMKQRSQKRRSLATEVGYSITTCDAHNFCPCPQMMAEANNASEADIIAVIQYLQPDRKQYCGTTGCSCVNL